MKKPLRLMRNTKRRLLPLAALLIATSLLTGCDKQIVSAPPQAPPKLTLPQFLKSPPPTPSWLASPTSTPAPSIPLTPEVRMSGDNP